MEYPSFVELTVKMNKNYEFIFPRIRQVSLWQFKTHFSTFLKEHGQQLIFLKQEIGKNMCYIHNEIWNFV